MGVMRILLRTAVCMAAMAAFGWTADNEITAGEKAAGWKLMFDGKSFAGWEDPSKKSPAGDSFGIDDGCLKALKHPRINEDLFTLDTYSDFEMEFDWNNSPFELDSSLTQREIEESFEDSFAIRLLPDSARFLFMRADTVWGAALDSLDVSYVMRWHLERVHGTPDGQSR